MLKQFPPRDRPDDAINVNPRFFLECPDGGFRPGAEYAVDGQATQLPLHAFHPDSPASPTEKVSRIVGEQVAPGHGTNDSIHCNAHFPLELLHSGFSTGTEN